MRVGARVRREYLVWDFSSALEPQMHLTISASFHLMPSYDLSSSIRLFCNAIPGQPCSLGCLVYNQIHNSIKALKSKVTSNLASSTCKVKELMAVCQNMTAPKLSQRIDKNAIIANYDKDCHKIGYSSQVTTVKEGEPTYLPTTYPTIFQLVRDCLMKSSTKHHYQVKDLVFDSSSLWFKKM
jgi:hypothetical protein